MVKGSFLKRRVLGLVLVGCAVTASTIAASAQDGMSVSVTAADRAAARSAKLVHRSARPTTSPRPFASRFTAASGANGVASLAHSDSSDHGAIIRNPGDLGYLGGAVLGSTQSHAIYLKPGGVCPVSSCWGNPEGFLRDLGNSDFIHVVDQYTGLTSNHRYTVGNHASLSYTPPSTPLTDDDMLAVVHAVAAHTGKTGYGHMYHVFLPPGQDECFDSTYSTCYSPDNNPSFYFCAYHSSVDFTDIGHVIYSVEPYQNVPGCSIPPGTPNGQLVDSTDNVLSHEVIEAITDPDGDAWWNFTNNDMFGSEIADECSFIVFTSTGVYFDPPSFRVGHNQYAVQLEYSNSRHACANQ